MTLPDNDIISANAPAVLISLNENLKIIRDLSRKFQLDLVQQRDNSNQIPSTLNKYSPGDFILFQFDQYNQLLNKLMSKYLGPYSVITHIKNDITCRNLITAAISVFNCNRCKPFYGNATEAEAAALRDAEQYYIDKFITYRGDPLVRTTISFYILFADGCYHWKPWSNDLFETTQYEEFCSRVPQLSPLVVRAKEAQTLMRTLNLTPITTITLNTTVYLDLRAFGAFWYESLDLPNPFFSFYVVPMIYKSWGNTLNTRLTCLVPSLRIEWRNKQAINHFFVKSWGSNFTLTPDMTLISDDFIKTHKLIEKLL